MAEAKQRQLLEAEDCEKERARAKRRAAEEKKAAKERRAAERRAEEATNMKNAAEAAECERRRQEQAQAQACSAAASAYCLPVGGSILCQEDETCIMN